MRRLTLLVVLLVACGDDDVLPFDAGMEPRFDVGTGEAGAGDAGGDAGMSDSGPDAADGGDDAGEEGDCLFSFADGLSDACFPACEEGLLGAFLACGDYDCVLEVLGMGEDIDLEFTTGDPAEDVVLADYLRRTVEATTSCHQCETLVTRACEHDVCPEESEAFFDCMRGLTGETSCFPRSMAVFDCSNSAANQDTFYDCYALNSSRCFRE